MIKDKRKLEMSLELTQENSGKYPILVHTIIRAKTIEDAPKLIEYWIKIKKELKNYDCKAFFKFDDDNMTLFHLSYWENDESMKKFVNAKVHRETRKELKDKVRFVFYYGTEYKRT